MAPVTWTRAELSRLLLDAGGRACDTFVEQEGSHKHYCQHCCLALSKHLMKQAAEEIEVFDRWLLVMLLLASIPGCGLAGVFLWWAWS